MQHPDEGVIHTWLDGELPAEEAVALEAHIAECADCAAAVAEARGLIAASSRIVSALDIVPGDVIPAAAPRKRAWYASTQLRAAAAVLIVAGASFVVMRSGGEADIRPVMDKAESAPAAASTAALQTDAPSVAKRNEPATAGKGAQPPAQRRVELRAPAKASSPAVAADAMKERAAASNEADVSAKAMKVADTAEKQKVAPQAKTLEGKVAGVQAAAPAPVMLSDSSAALAQRTARQRPFNTERLDEVVVTGVATSTAKAAKPAKPLREVKSDTTTVFVVTVYEVSPGIQVTLVEHGFPEMRSGTARGILGPQPPALPAPPAGVRMETVTWTNLEKRRSYTLVGPLSSKELTELRKRLPPAKQ